MLQIDITVPVLGTRMTDFENALLATFEKIEYEDVKVIERALQARCGSSHTARRYRVYTHLNFVGVAVLLHDLVERLQGYTNIRITVSAPRSCSVHERDRATF